MTISVLVCDDHAIVRQGIKQILADASDVELAGEASSGPEAIATVRAGGIDVLLLDIALPQPDPSAAADVATNPNQVVMTLEEAPGGGAVISVNKSPVSNLEDLETKLRDIYQTKSDKTMFVKASGKIAYGKVVEAMDIARGAGVERIGIISESMDGGGAPAPGGGTGQ